MNPNNQNLALKQAETDPIIETTHGWWSGCSHYILHGRRKKIYHEPISFCWLIFFLACGFLEALIIWIFFYLGTVSMKNFHLSLLSIRTCGPLVPRAKVVPVQWKLFPAKSMIEDDRKKTLPVKRLHQFMQTEWKNEGYPDVKAKVMVFD